jgi:hypothetical protein
VLSRAIWTRFSSASLVRMRLTWAQASLAARQGDRACDTPAGRALDQRLEGLPIGTFAAETPSASSSPPRPDRTWNCSRSRSPHRCAADADPVEPLRSVNPTATDRQSDSATPTAGSGLCHVVAVLGRTELNRVPCIRERADTARELGILLRAMEDYPR